MTRTTIFDVIIVYSDRLASSASRGSDGVLAPFPKGSSKAFYNIVYGYLLKTCQKYHLKAAFTTSSDVVGAGRCRSYWLFENGKWISVQKPGYSKLIFDKFSPVSPRIKLLRDLLFSSRAIKPFNHPYVFNLFFDKQKTYNKLHNFSIPTVSIEKSTGQGVDKACRTLKKLVLRHAHQEDFSDEIVMKDRFGAGGRNVYKFKTDQTRQMAATMLKNKYTSFVIQPFAKFNKGFSYQERLVSADIRLIYLGKRIVQTYIRMAKVGDFRCNEHQGGVLKYISKNEVPQKVIAASKQIVKLINTKTSLFALDFVISNNGNVYFLEGNTGPGLDWNFAIKENEIEAQKLIRIIVRELVRRIRVPVINIKKEVPKRIFNVPIIDDYVGLSEALILGQSAATPLIVQ